MMTQPDKTPEISIIVPVYNVERYLRECLDSIKSQSFNDWECILVDDGSPDNSIEICNEYADRDERFNVIRRENGGLSAARNTGLRLARGRFIAFVDSDDVVCDRYLERLYELITVYEADVAQVSYELMFTTFVRARILSESITILHRGEAAIEMIRDKHIPSYVWNKLFRREVIDAPFPEGYLYEDMYALSRWARNIKKMVISSDILYSYRQRAGGIVNSKFVNNRIEYMKGVISRAETLQKLEPSVIHDECVVSSIWCGMVRAGKHIARNIGGDEVQEAIMRLSALSKTLSPPSAKTLGVKTWWRAHLLRDHPLWFMHILSFDRRISIHYQRVNNNMFE